MLQFRTPAMRRASVLLLALPLVLLGVLGLVRMRSSLQAPRRIHVVVVPSSDPGGLDVHQREGLRQLIGDQLETLGGFSLLEGLAGEASLPEGSLRLRVRATFWDGHLRLEAAWEGRGSPGAARVSSGTPDWAISDLLHPLDVPAAQPGLYRPEDPAACVELMGLMGRPVLDDATELVARFERLAASHPGCATIHYGLGGVRYIASLNHPGERAGGPQRCEEAYRTGMALLPGLPRGVRNYAFFAADSGRVREALEASLACVDAHPGSANAAMGVAYPARISGLLDLSERAMLRQSRLTGLPRTMHTTTDNTRLYRGDIPGFAASLELPQMGAQSAILDFYRGYVRLLAGDRVQALPFFRRALEGDAAIPGFRPLSRIYALALEGREAEARAELDALARSRQMAQVLDGEFTFKVAEAYGFMGQPKEALDYANHAATQGFICLRWYEVTPFLEGARKLEYWATLRRHLQERQAAMARLFPASRLTP
jgi:tetratricopeptide (TPR) repeat protein